MKRLITKYINLPVQVKASFWFTLCNVIQSGIQVMTLPIFTRLMTVDDYGISTLYVAWENIIIIFATLRLFSGVFNNGMMLYERDRDSFVSSMQGLSTVSACVCILVYLATKKILDPYIGLPEGLMSVMLIYYVFQPGLKYWTARQRYEYKYKLFTTVTICFSVVTSLVSLLFVMQSHNKGIMKIVGFVLSATVINLGFYIYNFCKGKKFFDLIYWKFALKFNIPLIPHYLSMIILSQIDRIMIAAICGQDKAAIYGVAYVVGNWGTIFIQAILASFVPWIYEQLKHCDYSKIREVTSAMLAVFCIGIAFIMFMAPEVIAILATKEYRTAIYVIPPVVVSTYFNLLYELVSTVEFFYEKSKNIMVVSTMGALLNILLNLLCIRYWGVIAAAYTTLICYMFFAVCHYLLMRKICRDNNIIEQLFSTRVINILSIIMFLLLLLMNRLYTNTCVRYAGALIFGGAIFIALKKILVMIKKQS